MLNQSPIKEDIIVPPDGEPIAIPDAFTLTLNVLNEDEITFTLERGNSWATWAFAESCGRLTHVYMQVPIGVTGWISKKPEGSMLGSCRALYDVWVAQVPHPLSFEIPIRLDFAKQRGKDA